MAASTTNPVQIEDEHLDKFTHRLAGAVVLVTGGCSLSISSIPLLGTHPSFLVGGANGIGREVALRCAKHGCVTVCLLE
jgi:NAD(P)-dependent dehydrogenase (short-subunit alcohol dehydrogenase family)